MAPKKTEPGGMRNIHPPGLPDAFDVPLEFSVPSYSSFVPYGGLRHQPALPLKLGCLLPDAFRTGMGRTCHRF